MVEQPPSVQMGCKKVRQQTRFCSSVGGYPERGVPYEAGEQHCLGCEAPGIETTSSPPSRPALELSERERLGGARPKERKRKSFWRWLTMRSCGSAKRKFLKSFQSLNRRDAQTSFTTCFVML